MSSGQSVRTREDGLSGDRAADTGGCNPLSAVRNGEKECPEDRDEHPTRQWLKGHKTTGEDVSSSTRKVAG